MWVLAGSPARFPDAGGLVVFLSEIFILAEGAIALPVTLSGGALFAS